jgi:hypothetical protein
VGQVKETCDKKGKILVGLSALGFLLHLTLLGDSDISNMNTNYVTKF